MKKYIVFILATLTVGSAQANEVAASKSKRKVIEVSVTEKGYEPSSVQAKAGDLVTLQITRKTDKTCAKEISVPSLKIKKKLPLDTPVNVELGALKEGEVKFVCGMNMISGVIILN